MVVDEPWFRMRYKWLWMNLGLGCDTSGSGRTLYSLADVLSFTVLFHSLLPDLTH